MSVIEVFLLILVIAAILLCVYIFISLKKLNAVIESVDGEVKTLKEKIYPMLDDISEITKRVNDVTEKVEGYVNEVENQVVLVKDKITQFKNFGERNRPENRVQELFKNLIALKKGITAFWERFANK